MKRQFIFLIFISCSFFLYGQQLDTTSKNKRHHNYISINPLNTLFCQQAGISYEFKAGRIGMEITPGYIYRTNFLFCKWGVEGPKNYGEIGSYNGYFFVPQINFYISKNKNRETGNSCYLSLKGVYKNLHSDSSQSHFWEKKSGGDDYWIYRKQDDKLQIKGAYILFCNKHYYKKHFFTEMYIGPGVLDLKHDLIIVGQHSGQEEGSNVSNINPPQTEQLSYGQFTINFGFSVGLKF
jgi:hypothetical protein